MDAVGLDIIGKLLSSGITGLIAALFIVLFLRKDKDLQALRKEYEENSAKQNEKHAADLAALVDRHMARSESWITKYHENAAAQTDALKALAGKFSSRKGQ